MRFPIGITGSTGFIGSRLLQFLGKSAIPYTNEKTECRSLVHLAGVVGVQVNNERKMNSVWDELDMHQRVFRDLSNRKLPLFLASSSEVYGSSEVPMRETDPLFIPPPGQTRWMYARMKSMNEQLASMYHFETGEPVIVGRFFNVCGPGQQPESGMVMPNFIKNALLGRPLTIFGSPYQTRTFTHVDDAVHAISELLQSDTGFKVYNIGSENTCTIGELAELILQKLNSSSKIEVLPVIQPQIATRIPDVSLLKQRLPDWNPKKLDIIIQETASWMEGILSRTL
jgi:UDP-glucose 4-epimerase